MFSHFIPHQGKSLRAATFLDVPITAHENSNRSHYPTGGIRKTVKVAVAGTTRSVVSSASDNRKAAQRSFQQG